MPKPLVLSDIRNRAGAFVAEWRDAEGYEKGEAQEFVRGLLRCFGISGRTAAVYEKRARRSSTGKHGFIDALISGTVVIEMKSAGRDLVAAEQQALDYIESLTEHERPDYILTSDFKRFRLLSLVAEAGGERHARVPSRGASGACRGPHVSCGVSPCEVRLEGTRASVDSRGEPHGGPL
ncbi:type IIL restriction-modification enzyme MmeI [Dermabacter hominis]|uniref:type IIL restriction-modification enzyme MmeI n=1 Tax=Dermabacter hominis TaxID=36740 RepID=UPI0035CD253B